MKFLALIYFFWLSLLISSPSKQQDFNDQQKNAMDQSLESNQTDDYEAEKRDGFNFLISGGRKDVLYTQNIKYMVSIRTRGPQRYFGDNHYCAGTLIRRSTVITAAHCLMSPDKVLIRARLMLIVAGTPNRLKTDPHTTRQYPVAHIRVHPFYIQQDTHDIAVITIKGQIPDDNEMIQRIPLPKEPAVPGKTCTILGWGRIYPEGPLAALPLYTDITLFTPDVCEERSQFYKRDVGMLCGGADDRIYADPCRGDAGGPLICDGYFTGVVSWTVGCGTTIPSMYTDVYRNLDFILNSSNALDMAVYILIGLIGLVNFM